jgi:hypothetical protein
MARFIFAFEGLWGYGQNGWNDVCANKPLDGHEGGNLLKRLVVPGFNFVAGGGSHRNGSSVPGPRDTVLCYYAYGDADKAAAYGHAVGIDRPFDLDGEPAYHTLVVVGHSFGGDASWRFVSLVEMASAPVSLFSANLAITFDPRSIQDMGNNDDHSSWRLNPEIVVGDWHNYYRRNALAFKGYALPENAKNNVVNDPQPDNWDHTGMIKTIWPEPWAKIQAVGPARKSSTGNLYL